MKLSIVVPCYNEAQNIPSILECFAQFFNSKEHELLLVNNGSTDESAEVLLRHIPRYPFAKTVTIQKNQGYGYGILTGLLATKGDYLGWTHADLQTDPKDTLKAFQLIEKSHSPNNCYAKGLRKRRPFQDAFFTFGMSVFESCLLKTPLWDINGQPNIFHRSFFETLDLATAPHDFSLDLFFYASAKKQGLNILRFPVLFPKREKGISSWNFGIGAKFKLIKNTVNYSNKLRSQFKA